MRSFIQNTINSSKIISYIKGPDYGQKVWANGLISAVLNIVFNGPCNILKMIYSKLRHSFDNSLLLRPIRYLTDRMHILIGLFLILNMIIPDYKWHNEYGVYLSLLLFFVFVLKTMITPESRFDISSIDYSAILFFVCIMMAGITSLFPRDSLNYMIYYFISFLTIAVIVSTIKSPEYLYTLIRLICFGTFLTSIYGIYQWKIIGVAVNPSETDLTLSQDLGGRVYSTMGNPNVYGMLLVLTIPFFIALILNEKPLLKKCFWGVLLLPVLLILFKTGSRGSWVAFAVSIFVFLFFWNKKLIPVFLFLGLIAMPFLPSPIYNRILTIFNPNDNSRKYRNQISASAISMLKDYWTTGVGLGSRVFSAIFHNYKSFGLTKAAHAHNLILEVWLEAGIAAIVTFFLMIFKMTRNTFAAVREKTNVKLNNILSASLSAIAGIIVMGLADYVWFYNRILFMFWIVAAILFTALKLVKSEKADV